MGLLKKGINIGKTIAKRVKAFPVYSKEPKKHKKKLLPWILCPDFIVKPPKVVNAAASEKDYSFSIQIFSGTRRNLDKALNHMISCGKKEIEAGNKRFWLHAVSYKIQRKAISMAELKYIFRVRQIPEEIS